MVWQQVGVVQVGPSMALHRHLPPNGVQVVQVNVCHGKVGPLADLANHGSPGVNDLWVTSGHVRLGQARMSETDTHRLINFPFFFCIGKEPAKGTKK